MGRGEDCVFLVWVLVGRKNGRICGGPFLEASEVVGEKESFPREGGEMSVEDVRSRQMSVFWKESERAYEGDPLCERECGIFWCVWSESREKNCEESIKGQREIGGSQGLCGYCVSLGGETVSRMGRERESSLAIRWSQPVYIYQMQCVSSFLSPPSSACLPVGVAEPATELVKWCCFTLVAEVEWGNWESSCSQPEAAK
ncbi:anaphase promoting complex 3 [Corchorus olitorius]|uniref:Anaphase promoting complex 3 n=1 Tax=Corchorus olitorius TaxID=93759 RepID=A0A1R3ITT5_9ROSI|nr:anaphase promoting complex 3 [Corchorus olitorius]